LNSNDAYYFLASCTTEACKEKLQGTMAMQPALVQSFAGCQPTAISVQRAPSQVNIFSIIVCSCLTIRQIKHSKNVIKGNYYDTSNDRTTKSANDKANIILENRLENVQLLLNLEWVPY
jgi:hypothetical protein